MNALLRVRVIRKQHTIITMFNPARRSIPTTATCFPMVIAPKIREICAVLAAVATNPGLMPLSMKWGIRKKTIVVVENMNILKAAVNLQKTTVLIASARVH